MVTKAGSNKTRTVKPTRRTRTTPGDFTGKVKADSQRAQAKAAEERQAEQSMANQVEDEDMRTGVFDPVTGERLNAHSVDEALDIEDEEDEQYSPQNRGFFPGEPVLTGKETPEEIDPIIASRKAFTPQAREVVRSAMATIRVDVDIEDMTYGMKKGEPNNYTFKEGLAYRVPTAVADHLNERGLIRQWID